MTMNRAVTAPMGRLMKKHQRQETLSVKAPPKSGPATLAMPYMDPMMPVYVGRCRSGTAKEMMRIAPVNMPAAPRPAIARPIIKAVDVGAAPQTAEPTSKMSSAMR